MYVTVYIHEQDEYLTYENWTANFDCIHCQNFSMKTEFILGFLFIMITLVDLHNTHVLNYTKNIFKKLHTKYQKTFSSPFSRLLPNIRK